jgi:hypothetical protein
MPGHMPESGLDARVGQTAALLEASNSHYQLGKSVAL